MTLAAVVDQRSVIIPLMEIAQLVLDYVRALVWPVLLAAILWMGRKRQDPGDLVGPVAETVNQAMYWQAPHDEDALTADPT